jgi:hypothetical protein
MAWCLVKQRDNFTFTLLTFDLMGGAKAPTFEENAGVTAPLLGNMNGSYLTENTCSVNGGILSADYISRSQVTWR